MKAFTTLTNKELLTTSGSQLVLHPDVFPTSNSTYNSPRNGGVVGSRGPFPWGRKP